MLGAEPGYIADSHRLPMTSQQSGVPAYMYGMPPSIPAANYHQTHHVPPSIDSGFYPPPWPPSGYGMFPFGPPPAMIVPELSPGMGPPQTEFCGGDNVAQANYAPTRKGLSALSPPLVPTRERFSYTRYQLELLAAIYQSIRYPNSMQKQLVAKRVGITRDQVKVWFQNRRRKDVVGKTSAKDEYLQTSARKMVPNDVIGSVLDELLAYKNNDKESKIKHAMNRNLDEKKRKAAQTSSDNRGHLPSSPASTCTDATNLSFSSSGNGSPLAACDAMPPLSDVMPPLSDVMPPLSDVIFNEMYRPSALTGSGHVGAASERATPYEHQRQDVNGVQDSLADLPMPTAGQRVAQTVQSYVTASSPIDVTSVSPVVSPLVVVGSLTPLTSATTDTDSSDSTSTHASSLADIDASRALRESTSREAGELAGAGGGGVLGSGFLSSLDIINPPNTIVIRPNSAVAISLKRYHDDVSSSDNEAANDEVEPPRKRSERLVESDVIPPNEVAPASRPIRLVGRQAYVGLTAATPTARHRAQTDLADDGQLVSLTTTMAAAAASAAMVASSEALSSIPLAGPQWTPRPCDIQNPIPYHPHHPHSQMSGTLPTKPTLAPCLPDTGRSRVQPLAREHPPSAIELDPIGRDPCGLTQLSYLKPTAGVGYPWDARPPASEHPGTKQTTDKATNSHLLFLSPDCSKLPAPLGYDSAPCYTPLASGGRHDIFMPWSSYPVTCPPYLTPAVVSSINGADGNM